MIYYRVIFGEISRADTVKIIELYTKLNISNPIFLNKNNILEIFKQYISMERLIFSELSFVKQIISNSNSMLEQ